MKCQSCGNDVNFCSICGAQINPNMEAKQKWKYSLPKDYSEEHNIWESPPKNIWYKIGHFLNFFNVNYKLTTHRIIIETGTMSSTKRELQLDNICESATSQNFWQKLQGLGNLHLFTNGDYEKPKYVIKNIKKHENLQDQMRLAIKDYVIIKHMVQANV